MKRVNAKQKHPNGTPEGRSLMHDQPFGLNALASVRVARLVLSTTPAVGRTFLIYRLICHQHSLCSRWRLRGVSTANGRILTINRNNWPEILFGRPGRIDLLRGSTPSSVHFSSIPNTQYPHHDAVVLQIANDSPIPNTVFPIVAELAAGYWLAKFAWVGKAFKAFDARSQ